MQKARKFQLRIDAFTWEKDNYDLFDYETRSVFKMQVETDKEGQLVRHDNQISYSARGDEPQLEPDTQKLLNVEQVGEDVFVNPDGNQPLWAVTRSQDDQNEGTKVAEGQIIKLGKKMFMIKKIKDNVQYQDDHYSYSTSDYHSKSKKISNLAETFLSCEHSEIEEDRQNQQCRICLSYTTQKINPLVSVCKCNGSMRWIHFECLRQWIQSKLQMKMTESVIELNSKAVRCELCQEYYPPSFDVRSEVFNLYDVGSDFTKYVMLEDKEGPLYILNFSTKSDITVGRGHNCDFKIGEITVSRSHLQIRLQNGILYLKDQNSKFGTLILIQKRKLIHANQELQLQSGRTLIIIKRKSIKGFMESLFGFCCAPTQNAQDQLDMRHKLKRYNNSFEA